MLYVNRFDEEAQCAAAPQPYPFTPAVIEHKSPSWSPYEDNGGTILGIAGKDYAVVVGDTRLSRGYSILDRDTKKWVQLTPKVVLGSSGQRSEIVTLRKHLKARIAQYEFDHKKSPSVDAVAAMLSVMLYSRRFFPFYTFNLVAGLDESGQGKVFGYDAIGSYDSVSHVAKGSATEMVTASLDLIVWKSHQSLESSAGTELSKEAAVTAGVHVMRGATERDIATGDFLDVVVIDSSGVHTETRRTRQD